MTFLKALPSESGDGPHCYSVYVNLTWAKLNDTDSVGLDVVVDVVGAPPAISRAWASFTGRSFDAGLLFVACFFVASSLRE